MARLLPKGILCKCIGCRHTVVEGRVISKELRLVICNSCKDKYIWNSKDRYYHSRGNISASKSEGRLRDRVMSILNLRGNDLITDVGFPDWGYSVRGGILRFDICIPKYRLLIDYHGEQHYKYIPYIQRGGPEEFQVQKRNDRVKYMVAPVNGWTYLVVNYTEDMEDRSWLEGRLRRVSALRSAGR